MKPAKVGIVGCGQISGRYLENSKQFDAFDVVAVADVRLEAAQARGDLVAYAAGLVERG